MVGIIIVSHGPYAKALVESVQMVSGILDKTETICLGLGESVESLQDKIKASIKKLQVKEVLIMVDLLGGTPYNASSISVEDSNINVITGINMPMLLEILPYRNEDLKKVASVATEGGKNGIVNVKERYETLNKLRDINA